jgi:hypothetical protein
MFLAGVTVRKFEIDAALHLLAELDAATWARISDLAARHKAGCLSRDAWECATGALLEKVAAKVAR